MVFLVMEVWKDVPEFEGIYQASDLGRVKSLSRTVAHTKGSGARQIRERILHPGVNNKGYLHVVLSKNGITKSTRVHRIIAKLFNPNIHSDILEVNHKDGDKLNNKSTNLEWVTHHKNIIHSWEHGLSVPTGAALLIGSKHPSSKSVHQFTKDGVFIKEFGSVSEASRATGIFTSHISKVCGGKFKTAKGYKWKFKDESNET
jgi:hypothetical protein